MIKKFEVSFVHVEPDVKLRKYVNKKIRHLDYYVHRTMRDSVHAEVILKEGKAKNNNRHTCEVIMHLPHEVITVSESTVNMFAAIDIVEAKLKNQLKKYKDTHTTPHFHRRFVARLKRRLSRTPMIDEAEMF